MTVTRNIDHIKVCREETVNMCASLSEKYTKEIKGCVERKRELDREIYYLQNFWKKESLKSREK